MVDGVKTVSTQCFQLWMNDDLAGLGWHTPPPTLSGFVKPFDTWADMTHLASAEDWSSTPKTIAYFCSVLPEGPTPAPSDTAFASQQHEAVRQNAVSFLNQHVAQLWPNAVQSPGVFRWDLLADPNGNSTESGQGEDRFRTQFWIANINPTDRYVLSLPGTVQNRISPLDDTYDNLTVVGDWTECGLNLGCVEAAVMSGRLAAHQLSQKPRLDEIFGYSLRRPTVDRPSALNWFYEQLFTDQLSQQFYGNSGFANLGYWRAGTPDAATASNDLVDEVVALSPGVGRRVLDVACGEGGTTRRLASSVKPSNITAIGISRNQLTAARRLAPESDFLCMDAVNLGFADSSFDTVVCIEAAFHFRTRQAFLSEALRVLKPGGYLAMSDLLMARGTPLVPTENHLATPRAYEELLERCGFVDVLLSDATAQTWRAYRRRLTNFLIRESRQADLASLAARLTYINMTCAWAIRRCLLISARKPIPAGPLVTGAGR
jgi:SAM-dependent methyltransferase